MSASRIGELAELSVEEAWTLSDEEIACRICPGMPLDLGIARTVALLRTGGVETYEACEGTEGHSYLRPTVRFHGTFAAGWHALSVAVTYGLRVRELNRVWSITHGEPDGPTWELAFRDPPIFRDSPR